MITFNVRLNLKNPRHRKAWELLQSAGSSRVTTIVDALLAAEQEQASADLIGQLESILRRVLGEMLRAAPAALQQAEAEQTGGEISDEDFDIAGSFMSSLGL